MKKKSAAPTGHDRSGARLFLFVEKSPVVATVTKELEIINMHVNPVVDDVSTTGTEHVNSISERGHSICLPGSEYECCFVELPATGFPEVKDELAIGLEIDRSRLFNVDVFGLPHHLQYLGNRANQGRLMH